MATTADNPRPIRSGRTYDGKKVVLWSDGQMCLAHGFAIQGIGRAKSRVLRRIWFEAGKQILPELELFDGSELSTAIRAGREFVRKHFAASGDFNVLPGNLRRAMAIACKKGIAP